MDHISRVGVFVEVVKQESFAAAARVLGLSSSAVSKQVQNLEDQLCLKLLQRTTRRVMLTEEGRFYYERARQALEDLHEAEREVQDCNSIPRGTLKINLPMSFGEMYLRAPIAAFAKTYPDVQLDVSFEDRMVDVINEGFDAIIRIGVLQDSTLMKRKLADCPIVLCASPEYIAIYGQPHSPAALLQHRMILFTRHGTGGEWRWQHRQSGKTGSTQFAGVFRANTAGMMQEACLQGIGIAILPIFSAATYLRSGQLEQLLPDYSTHPAREIAILYPPNRHLSTKTRLFVDWMADACTALPWI
jgi:DNA-binding transcriptional LysR family regulator